MIYDKVAALRTIRSEESVFFKLYYAFSIMMIVNFFFTENPYSAFHSGRAGYGYSVISTSFKVLPIYLVILALVYVLIHVKQIVIDYKMSLLLGVFLVSGLTSQALFSDPQTYVYDGLAFFLTSTVALAAYNYGAVEIKNLNSIAKVLSLLLVAGAALAYFFPNRYGVLPFEFSRETRGEVTFWNVTSMISIFPTIAILTYRRYKTKKYLFLSLLMTIVLLSTSTRAHLVISVLPFIILIFFNAKPKYKVLLASLLIPFVFIFKETILSFVSGNNPGYSQDITNGRFELWSYHWNYFMQHPFFGAGSSLIERMGDYAGRANSEIGALSWFSQYGIIFGLILVAFVIKAALAAVRLLSKGKEITEVELFFSLIVLSMLPDLIQNHARILRLEDMVFWFSVFYLNAYRKPFLPYTKIL